LHTSEDLNILIDLVLGLNVNKSVINHRGLIVWVRRPVIVALLPVLSFFVGWSVAFVAGRQIQKSDNPWLEPYFWGVIFFEVFIIWPVGLYLLIVYPSWSTLYWMESEVLSAWSLMGLLLLFGIAAAVGYWLGVVLLPYQRDKILIGMGVAFVLCLALFLWLGGDRLIKIVENKSMSDAPLVFSTKLSTIFAFVAPAVLGSWLFLLVLFGTESKKVLRAEASTSPDYSGDFKALLDDYKPSSQPSEPGRASLGQQVRSATKKVDPPKSYSSPSEKAISLEKKDSR